MIRKLKLKAYIFPEKYILCYCSYFAAAVFKISGGIRNLVLQTLIKRVAWMKNTSSPHHFILKSWLRPDGLALVAFVVFVKI